MFVNILNSNIMKKLSVLLVLFVLCSNMMSQSLPIFEEGKTWVVDHTSYGLRVETTYTYIVRGDSIVDGISYKKVYRTTKENLEDLALYYLAREENGVAYFREDEKEHVLFDFNRKVGDEFFIETETSYYSSKYKGIITEISTVEGNDGIVRKSFTFDVFYKFEEDGTEYYPSFPLTFIEGIGEVANGIELDYCIGCTGGDVPKLRCIHDANGNHIYGNGDGCNPTLQSLPIFEEGKTWVVDLTKWGKDVYATHTNVVRGDSVVDGISYKKVYRTTKENLEDLALYYLAREENGVAYFREDEKEHVLFDFNRKVGDEFFIETETSYYSSKYKGIITEISTVEGNDGIVRKSFTFDVFYKFEEDGTEYYPSFPLTFIEGIGEVANGIELDYCIGCTGGDVPKLRCVHNADGVHIYGNGEGCKTLGIESIESNERIDNSIYDMTGRKFNEEPAKGIYIQGGKKYFKN